MKKQLSYRQRLNLKANAFGSVHVGINLCNLSFSQAPAKAPVKAKQGILSKLKAKIMQEIETLANDLNGLIQGVR